jgi:hypothetical protein
MQKLSLNNNTTPALDAAIIKAAAQLACDDIYDPVNPHAFGKLYRVGESVCGTTQFGGVQYIVMQGTELEQQEGDGQLHFSLQGWAADFNCSPLYHPQLGAVHAGFFQNLPALVKQLLPDLVPGARVVVTGHSKGAGEAALLGALLKLAGVDVIGLALLACPNPGYQRCADWLAENIPGVSFRNAPAGLEMFGDPVPLVPVDPYVAAYPFTYVDCAPAGLERAMSVAWHAGPLYIRGVDALLKMSDDRMQATG